MSKLDLIELRIDINYWLRVNRYSICELNSHINKLIEKVEKICLSCSESNLHEKELNFIPLDYPSEALFKIEPPKKPPANPRFSFKI